MHVHISALMWAHSFSYETACRLCIWPHVLKAGAVFPHIPYSRFMSVPLSSSDKEKQENIVKELQKQT